MIRIKRAYDPPERGDGQRFLVERLWPRGMKKEALAVDAWLKEVAPSTALRKWFGHREERWEEFRRRYRHELRASRRLAANFGGEQARSRDAPLQRARHRAQRRAGSS